MVSDIVFRLIHSFTIVAGSLFCFMRKLHDSAHRIFLISQYSTTYVGQVMAKESGKEPDAEIATRMGDLALLWYSIGAFIVQSQSSIYNSTDEIHLVAVIAGTLLPQLASRDSRLLTPSGIVNEDEETVRLRETVHEWRVEAARRGKPMRLPTMPFMLRNIWTGALLLFSFLMFSTFFVTTVVQVRFVLLFINFLS